MPAFGGAPKQLAEIGARPVWSPDGSLIAFQSESSGEVFNSRVMAPSTIWTVPSQGGTPKQITRPGNPPGGHSSPSWSPDAKRIAAAALPGAGAGSVWIIDPNSPAPYKKVMDLPAGVFLRGLTWTPDGSSLIVGQYRWSGDIFLAERSKE